MSPSNESSGALSAPLGFEDELGKAIQIITSQFLSNRHNLSSDKIVDVASPSTVISIRELAIPRATSRSFQYAIEATTQIFTHRIRNEHPRFFGFIPSPVSSVVWIADAVTAAFNVHAESWFQSSGPSAVEDSLCKWLAAQAGFPAGQGTGRVFVSGGSMANLTALMVARDQKLKFEERIRGVAYVSDQMHASVARGLRILGFRNEQIRKVKSDEHFWMDVAALKNAVGEDQDAGPLPFLVVATCGTTNTGSVDLMDEIADFAQSQNMWMHVDGAYGASVALSKSHRSLIKGVGRADSLSWDAHRWLFLTYGCGMVIVREKRLLVESLASNAEYIQDAAEEATHNPNFWNMSMELTRPARAMGLWFTL
jgi:L-2,4-diaminobutyrate decarboxylase